MTPKVLRALRKIAAEYDGRVYEHSSPSPEIDDEPRYGGARAVDRAAVEHSVFNHAKYPTAVNNAHLQDLNQSRHTARINLAHKFSPEIGKKFERQYGSTYDPKKGLPPLILTYNKSGTNKILDKGDHTLRAYYGSPTRPDDLSRNFWTPSESVFSPTRDNEESFSLSLAGENSVVKNNGYGMSILSSDRPEAEPHEDYHFLGAPYILGTNHHFGGALIRPSLNGRLVSTLTRFRHPNDAAANNRDIQLAPDRGDLTYSYFDPLENARNWAGMKYDMHKQLGEVVKTPDDMVKALVKHGLATIDKTGYVQLTDAGRAWNPPSNDSAVIKGRNEIDRFVRVYNANQRAKQVVEALDANDASGKYMPYPELQKRNPNLPPVPAGMSEIDFIDHTDRMVTGEPYEHNSSSGVITSFDDAFTAADNNIRKPVVSWASPFIG